jgi:hypothetical protein
VAINHCGCIMSGPQIYKIFCIFEGRRTPWSVKIENDKSVDDLKEAIKNKKSKVLADVDADDLTLYRLDIREDEQLVENIQQEMSKNPTLLFTSMKMTDLYSEGPPERSVHILVRLPSGTQPFNLWFFLSMLPDLGFLLTPLTSAAMFATSIPGAIPAR